MTEEQLHKQICTYIKLQYPRVIFNTDLSGLKMTMGQAAKIKSLRSSNGFPDIQICEPSSYKIVEGSKYYKFCGLFLEVKKETPYKKNGTFKKNKHIENQRVMHGKLRAKGYYVDFVWTFEMAKEIIDNYLRL